MPNPKIDRDYKDLFLNIPIALYRTTPQGELIDANLAMLSLVGHESMDELLAIDVDALYVNLDDRRFFRKKLLENGFLSQGEFRLFRKNGEIIWVQDSAYQIVDEAGKVIYYEGSLIDITSRIEATDDLRDYGRLQEILARFGQFALTDVSLPDLLDEAVHIVSRALSVDYCKYLQLSRGRDHLLLIAGVGWQDGMVGHARVNIGDDSQAGYTLLTDQPVVVDDFSLEDRFTEPSILKEHHVVSGMSVIVGEKKSPYGVFGVHTKTMRRFDDYEVNFLQSIANTLAEGIKQRHVRIDLIDNQARYQALFENAADAIEIVDENDNLLDVNAHLCGLLGYTREELLQMNIADLHVPELRLQRGSIVCNQFVRYGNTVFETLHIHRDGRRIPVELSISQIHSKGERFFFVIVRDITLRRNIEQQRRESEAKFRTLLNSIDDIIFTLDCDGRHVNVFGKLIENGSISEDHYLGKTPREILGEQGAIHEIAHSKALTGHPVIFEWSLSTTKGEIEYYQTSLSPMRDSDDHVIGAVGIRRNITDLKEAQNELLRYQDHLEELIEQRTSELQERIETSDQLNRGMINLMGDFQRASRRASEAANQLSIANRELESFAYSVSHDLRAPLRSINGFAQILASRHRENLNPEGQKYIDYVVQSGEQMAKLIEDLLTYSRMGRKAVRRAPLNFADILGDIQTNLHSSIHATKAIIHLPVAWPPIYGDRTLIHQIFLNLIDNAIKYHKPGLPPEIWLDYRIETEYAMIWVRDNGVGISPEYQEKVFDMFQRLHSDDEVRGTGIGLALVRKAAVLMNGEVGIDSSENEGSTFWIKLPLEIQEE